MKPSRWPRVLSRSRSYWPRAGSVPAPTVMIAGRLVDRDQAAAANCAATTAAASLAGPIRESIATTAAGSARLTERQPRSGAHGHRPDAATDPPRLDYSALGRARTCHVAGRSPQRETGHRLDACGTRSMRTIVDIPVR